jgi:hypothetical protein
MRHKPEHTCFRGFDCPGCAFELGESLAKKKPTESAKYVWMVVNSHNPCDIRRYAFSHEQAISQLEHVQKLKRGYKDSCGPGTWTLFKLVRVSKKKG